MSDLYDTDFHEWAETQAALLRSRSASGLDWDNIAEEIESLAKSDEREVASRLLLICQHLLKWEYQPGRRTINWRSAIRVNRRDLGKLLGSKTLRNHATSILAASYADGREDAAEETGLLDLPATCPWTLEQVLDREFWPGLPWEADEP
ncbi:MAG: DUF29 domain-containing protein [Chloroflexota bacterium]